MFPGFWDPIPLITSPETLLIHSAASGASLSLAWFWVTREILCMIGVRFLLGMRGMLLGYSFEPGPNSRVFATASSVTTIGLSWKDGRTKKSQSGGKEQDWLVPKTVLRRPQSLTWFSQSLLFYSSLKKTNGLCSRGASISSRLRFNLKRGCDQYITCYVACWPCWNIGIVWRQTYGIHPLGQLGWTGKLKQGNVTA